MAWQRVNLIPAKGRRRADDRNVGTVATQPIPEPIRGVNAFTLGMLHLFTILILVLITRTKGARTRSGAPASLGTAFQREA